jgi:hypothetical protein
MLNWNPTVAGASAAWKRIGYVRIVVPTMSGWQGRRM